MLDERYNHGGRDAGRVSGRSGRAWMPRVVLDDKYKRETHFYAHAHSIR